MVRCFIQRSHFLHSYLQKIAGIIRVRVFFEKMQYIFIFTKNWDTKIGWQSSHTKHSVFFNYCYINYDEYYMGSKCKMAENLQLILLSNSIVSNRMWTEVNTLCMSVSQKVTFRSSNSCFCLMTFQPEPKLFKANLRRR